VLYQTATELRQELGGGALVVKALEKPRPLVVSGIRSLGEAKSLQAAGGVMVYVDADPQVRYERVKGRRRDNETELSFDEFLAAEEKEMRGGDTVADFNIRAIGDLADLRLDNSGELGNFIVAATESLIDFGK
jgi:dephospho-CoA kinase